VYVYLKSNQLIAMAMVNLFLLINKKKAGFYTGSKINPNK